MAYRFVTIGKKSLINNFIIFSINAGTSDSLPD
jgi:hypothetical protein